MIRLSCRFALALALLIVSCGAAGPEPEATTPSDAAPAPAAAAAVSSPAPAEADAPLDFITDARLLARVLACAGDEPLPAAMDAEAWKAHCAKLDETVAAFEGRWLAKATPFLASIRPAKLPERVVYPFGGGDLISTLVTFPDAREYTTVSVEPAGDPRGLAAFDAKRLAAVYRRIEGAIASQFLVAHSKTETLAAAGESVPGSELVFALVALKALKLAPVQVRYFALEKDGALRYLTAAELAATPADKAAALFDNMELTFQPAAGGAARVFRHMDVNLDNDHLEHSGLFAHLAAKGRVAAMTKAASYLLWAPRFSSIRDYLLKNMDWMISDSTGVPPAIATAAGFTQVTYGRFEGPFLSNAPLGVAPDMMKMWSSQPYRALPMAYGYPDNNHHYHLLLTQPAAGKPTSP